MASGVTAGMAAGHWLAGGELAERFLLIGSNWLLVFLGVRLIAPAALATARQRQQWNEERRRSASRP